MYPVELDAKQREGVERALAHSGYCFTMQPRVGKTRTALAVVYRRPDITRLLIAGPKIVFPAWKSGLAEWPGLSDRLKIRVINYEQTHSKKGRKELRKWLRGGVSMLIGDEIHRIKKRGTKQSKGMRTMARCCRYVIGLTGTPIAQGVHDAWAICDFIDPSIFGKWHEFSERFCVYGGWMNRKIVGHKNLDEFSRILDQYSFRVLLKDVTKTPIKIKRRKVLIDLGPVALRHYSNLEKRLYTTVRRKRVEAPLVITLVQKLQILTGGWVVGRDVHELVDRAKLTALEQLLSERPKPLVVCFKYLHELEQAKRICQRLDLSVREVRGKHPLDTPFVEDVALVQIASGLGNDLSASRTVIFYSWDYSFINYEQMRFRVLSRTQTVVEYLFLMVKNSIDFDLYEAITKKRKLSDVVIDHYRKEELQ